MKYVVTIETDNADFVADVEGELARILRNVAMGISSNAPDWTRKVLRDSNGNTVGRASYED